MPPPSSSQPAPVATGERPPRTDELRLYLQPVVDLAGGHVAGWEALVRWSHPAGALVHPGGFIPAAERTGAIHGIGAWVLRRSVAWRSGRDAGQFIGVNVSAVELGRPGFAAQVERALDDHGLPADRLLIEVTESAAIGDLAEVVAVLLRLRELGVWIAVDDAGTGFSDADRVLALPAQVLKLDEALVGALPHPEALEACHRWVGLAASLGMRVVAEGVRTAEQARLVMAMGCTWGQGELYGAAAPAGRT